MECEEGWNPFNLLQNKASQTGALDLGYKAGVESIKEAKPKVVFLMGADEGVIGPDDVSFFKKFHFTPSNSNSRSPRTASSYTSVTRVIRAPPTPTSFSPAPPTPRRTASTSIPRAVFNSVRSFS